MRRSGSGASGMRDQSVSRSYSPPGTDHSTTTKEASSKISDALTNGLAQLLDETVEGPLSRAFSAIDRKFDDLTNRMEHLETENKDLRVQLSTASVVGQIRGLEIENEKLRDALDRESRQRQKEVEIINTVVKQFEVALDHMDHGQQKVARQNREKTLRAIMFRIGHGSMTHAFNAWRNEWCVGFSPSSSPPLPGDSEKHTAPP